jgi:hypothetical protein
MRSSRQRREWRLAASNPSRCAAVWQMGAAPVDRDPWAREDKASTWGGGRQVEHGEKAARSASASGVVSMQRLAPGMRGTLGVQLPPTGGPGRRERSLTSRPLSILFPNEIKLSEIELTTGKIARLGEKFPEN